MLFLCWFLFPLLLLVLALGHGLLVRAFAGGRLEPALVVPVGGLSIIVVATAMTWFDSLAELSGLVLVLVALIGLWTGRGLVGEARGRARAGVPLALLTLAAFGAFGASTFLTGTPTFTGYTQIVDIGHQFDFAAWLAQHGRALPARIDSSQLEQVGKLVRVGYPSGSQAPFGSLGRLIDVDVSWIYQPYLAFYAALLVPALEVLLRRAIPGRGLRLVGAFVASQPSLLIGYGQMGGVKEVLGAVSLAVVGALLQEQRSAPTSWRSTVPLAVALAAGFAVLSLTLAPWIGLIGVGALVLTATSGGRGFLGALRHWLPALGVFLVLSVPTLVAATHTGSAGASVKSTTDIGNLAAPIDKIAAAGVWLTPDHRYPLTARRTETLVGDWLVLALALGGLAFAVRRRDGALLVIGGAGAVAFAFMMHVFGPWVQLKTFVLTGPVVLALAVAGLGAVSSVRRLRLVAWIPMALLAAFVLYGDALRYHDATPAPYERLRELEAIGTRFAGQGPALYPNFDEHAEFQLRRESATSLVNPVGGVIGVRPDVAAGLVGQQFSYDLDQLTPEFVQSFNLIVLRYGPLASRPPSNFRLVYRGRYDEVWRKTGPLPAGDVHAPLSSTGSPQDLTACRAFARSQRGARLEVAPGARTATADPTLGAFSPGWTGTPGSGVLNVHGPGRATTTVDVPRAGRFAVWIQSASVRAVDVRVDGRHIGSVDHSLSYPGAWDPVGRVQLGPGTHTVVLTRPDGSLAPGNGDGMGHALGPVILVADPARPALVGLPARSASCPSGPLDWIEAAP